MQVAQTSIRLPVEIHKALRLRLLEEGKSLSTVKLQMEYYKQIGKTPVIPLLLGEGAADE